MNHLLHVTAAGLQPLWKPGTPWKVRRALARAYRAFADGIDPHDIAPGYYRFGVDDDGNALIGARVERRCGRCRQPLDLHLSVPTSPGSLPLAICPPIAAASGMIGA